VAELVSSASPSRPALFLDRDGVINEDPGWISSPRDLVIFPFAAKAIRLANRAGFLVIVVSNQSVVSRGMASAEMVDEIHAKLTSELKRDGARVDAFYFCPHHPDFSGPCRCRKPQTGLIDRAVAENAVDVEGSFLIGDTTGDLLTGENAGLRTILVRTGKAGQDGLHVVQPDTVCDDLLAAVRWIIERSEADHDTPGEAEE
jgi:histidinol-phosphate phosphatase family protein